MSKIIIENRSEVLNDVDAINLVTRVIEQGRVSDNGKQYCYATRFSHSILDLDLMVVSRLNKESDKFYVYDAK